MATRKLGRQTSTRDPAMATSRRVVLHVTESYGAGTATAIHRFVQSVPEVEHHLLRRVRSGSSVAGDYSAFASVHDLPAPGPKALAAIRRVAGQVRPTTVHLHSAYAGILGRTALVKSRRTTLLYSPHCFAFERRDLHPAVRAAVVAAERFLSFNTTLTVACSHREVALAKRLRPGARAVYVPNIAPAPRLTTSTDSGAPVVVTIGRADTQKDPGLFAAVAREVHRRGVGVRFVWIGGGSAAVERALSDAGVEVTGWLSADREWPVVPQESVYLHTAAWEGFPLAILEAQSAGLPVIARRIPALDTIDRRLTADGATQLADEVVAVLTSATRRADNRAAWATEVAENSADRQRAALLACYGLATGT